MNIRKRIFLLLDKDKCIKKQLDEIKRANEDYEYAEQLKEKAIKELIKQANENIEFYKNKGIKEFKDFPIVNKNMMKENFASFRNNKNLKIGKIRHTSGSTRNSIRNISK